MNHPSHTASHTATRLLTRHCPCGDLGSLTSRERDVLRLMAQGRSNVGIGRELYVSTKTVEANVARVFTKLGLNAVDLDNRRVLAVLSWLHADAGHCERPVRW
jgi:DNA-binding NarL/FixJ family response regulator